MRSSEGKLHTAYFITRTACNVKHASFLTNNDTRKQASDTTVYTIQCNTTSQHAECFRDAWESVSKCNVIILCVDPADAAPCALALAKELDKGSDKAVFSFDLGVRNYTTVEEQ